MATEMCLYQHTRVPGDPCLRCGQPWAAHQPSLLSETNAVDPPQASGYMIGGSHYKSPDATGMCPHCRRPVEHWDWSYNLRGLEYAATKYLARWRDKGGLESLKKVIHYTQKIINIHFPEVVVTVSYSDAVLPERGEEIGGSQGVAKGSSAYQEKRLRE